MFYIVLITLHNITRWLVIFAAAWSLYRAFRGWLQKKDWVKADDQAGIIFTSVLDTQVLIGLLLYFAASPITQEALKNFGAAMQNPGERFFALEHVLYMVVAVVIAHAVRGMTRKMADAVKKHQRVAIGFTLSVIVILLAIPWPFLPTIGRPLLRLFGLII